MQVRSRHDLQFYIILSWRNIPITLKIPAAGVLSEIAFHEKAGRSQVDSSLASLNKVFCSPAEWPLSPCFHPHSRGAIRFARCVLGVLVSAGAAICLAPCGSALAEWNLGQAINAVTGTRLWAFCLFSSWNGFDFCFVFRSRRLPPRSFGCYCAMVRRLLRSPIGDAAAPPAFLRWRRSLASSRSSRRVRQASVPSVADHSRCRMVPRCVALPAPAAFADRDRLLC